MSASTITITGANGDEIQAYRARPDGDQRRGGLVLIHHMPGYDRWSKEVARRFAVDGFDVLMPNLHYREAPGADADDAAAATRAAGGVPDERLLGDVAGALEHLRSLPTSNGNVAVLGHCSGGRQSVLVACNLDVQGAVDCYGAFVVNDTPPQMDVRMTSLEDQLPNLRCPLLGIFGNEDSYPSPEHVDLLAKILDANGKDYEFHRYDGAGHGFFATDRPAYRQQQAEDAYRHIGRFFERVLGA